MNPAPSLDAATLATHADDGVERIADTSPPLHVSTMLHADNDQRLVSGNDVADDDDLIDFLRLDLAEHHLERREIPVDVVDRRHPQ